MRSQPDTGRINHPVWSFAPVLLLNGLVGMPMYLFAFFTAYYQEPVCYDEPDCTEPPLGWSHHLQFLMLIAVFAAVCGLIVLLAVWESEAKAGQIIVFGVLTSLALNATALGIGSIVSANHKDQNSVSADFSTTTDVLVALALFGIAAVCTWLAQTVRRTTEAA